MGRLGRASFLVALLLALPVAGQAQDSPAAASGGACAVLGRLSGLYRSEDGNIEARWAFTTLGETVRPGDSFLTEHTNMPAVGSTGPGPHYVLYGVVDADCASVSGKWRALFAPSDEQKLMTGDFFASLAPGTITITDADDDPDQPHGWVGISVAFVDEPDPPMQIVYAQPLELHGLFGKMVTVSIADQLAFAGENSATQTVFLADALEFHATSQSPGTIDLETALEFHAPSSGPKSIALTDRLAFPGKSHQGRTIDLAGALEFRGKPFGRRSIDLAEPLQFKGKQHGTRTAALSDTLTFHGEWPAVHTVTISEPLEFHRKRDETRSVALAGLSFHGKTPAAIRSVGLSGPLMFQGKRRPATRTVALPVRLAFPGDTASARAALTATAPDPAGAGPCGALLGDSIRRADFNQAIPQSADDITAEAIEKLRAAYAPYQKSTADALDTQADCMERRLESFRTLTALSPHNYWANNPAFNGATFYTGQIEAVRNAAHYLRQVDWELQGIEQAMKHAETFYIFDSVDDPQAMKFGLVTDGRDAPEFQDANSMRMRDFELLKKHAETDAAAMTTQRNRYFRRKLAQRFRYLDALMARTIAGLADWTEVENHVTRTFMPRVASAITTRVNELKDIHDETQPPTAVFVLPQGEFDRYFKEFSKLTQTTGPKIGKNSFRDFMNNKVWYDDYDPWPDASALSP